jgi:hypothetical protein
LKDKVKIVTLCSSRSISNSTNVEMEVAFVPKGATKTSYVVKIKSNETYYIPIESSYHDYIFVRPADFGYSWSRQGLYWKDIIGRKKNYGI